MTDSIQIDADITASQDGHEIRIHGKGNQLAVDADSWTPVLRLRRLHSRSRLPLPSLPPSTASITIKVRGSTVLTIDNDVRGMRRKLHPMGIIRSLLRRG